MNGGGGGGCGTRAPEMYTPIVRIAWLEGSSGMLKRKRLSMMFVCRLLCLGRGVGAVAALLDAGDVDDGVGCD